MRFSGTSSGNFWMKEGALLVLADFLALRMISEFIRFCCQNAQKWILADLGGKGIHWKNLGAHKSFQRLRELESEATELAQNPKIDQRRGLVQTLLFPPGGTRYTACVTHCHWTWGVLVIRTAADKASPDSWSCHYHCRVREWILGCLCGLYR